MPISQTQPTADTYFRTDDAKYTYIHTHTHTYAHTYIHLQIEVDLLIAYFRTDDADEDGLEDDFLTENPGHQVASVADGGKFADLMKAEVASVQSFR